MGTRSTIALEYADNTVHQVYCHWDGYLEHNGRILFEHYKDPYKLRDLMDLGGLSSLSATVEDTKPNAYHHWRGEELVINKFKNFEDYVANHQYEEYEYILRTDGKWYVATDSSVYTELETLLLKEAA